MTMNRFEYSQLHRWGGRSTAILALSFSGAVFGQDARVSSVPLGLEEVVVTATKRGEQRLQDIPMSLQALGSDALQKTMSDGLRDVIAKVPSLSAIDNGLGQSRLIIRGVNSGTEEFPETTASTVGLYFDESPIAAGGMNPDLRLFDLERVEVLRGPQGTLYGEGSMGGAVRIISKDANLYAYEGAAETAVSHNQEADDLSLRVNGMINAPLVEGKLALRAVASYRRDAGYVDNKVLGKTDINEGELKGMRLKLGYAPSDDMRLNVSYIYQRAEVDDRAEWMPVTANTRREFGLTDDYQTGRSAMQPGFDHMDLVNATLEWNAGNANVLSSTTFYERDVNQYVAFFSNVLRNDRKLKSFSQESRVTAEIGDRADFVLGGFFNWKDIARTQSELPVGAGGSTGGEAIFQRLTALSERQLAAFGELNFAVTERLTATAGVRWFNYEQEFENRMLKCGTGPGSYIPQPTNIVGNPQLVQDTIAPDCPRATVQTPLFGDGDGDVVTSKLNLSYKFNDDHMVYVQAAEGFRVGGVNPAIDSLGNVLPDAYGPDSLWTYEIGAKSTLFDGILAVNASVYRTDWRDLITNVLGPDDRTAYRTNAGEARIEGAEVDITLKPLAGLMLFAGAAYMDATLVKDEPLYATNPTAGRAGDRLPLVPRWTLNGAVQYEWLLPGDFSAFVRADTSYVDRSSTTFNPANSNYRVAGGYANTDFRVGLESDHYSVQLFVTNVFNRQGVVYQFLGTFTGPGLDPVLDGDRVFQTPRTIGIQAGMSF